MYKILLKIISLFLFILISALIFLTYFGFETDRFDNLIKKKTNEFNRYVKLEFNKTNIYLKPSKLNLVVKLKKPKILVKNNEINLSKLDFSLSIKSFFSSDFLVKKANIAFEENDIKDLIKITDIFLPQFINKELNKIFYKGKLEGEFIIPFLPNGKIGKEYNFSGIVKQATINLTNEFSIKNLTTIIDHSIIQGSSNFKAVIKKGEMFDLDLTNTEINLKRRNNSTNIESVINTKGNLNFIQIKKIFKVFNINTKSVKDVNGSIDLKTKSSFVLTKNLKIKDLLYLIDGNIENLEISTSSNKLLKEYFPEYNSKLVFNNTIIKLQKYQKSQSLEVNGSAKINQNYDNFEIKQSFDSNKKTFSINGLINLTNSKIKIPQLNYKKKKGIETKVNFDINFAPQKYYNITTIDLLSGETYIKLNNVKLNKDFEVIDFVNIKVKTLNEKIKNNDFLVSKKKNIVVKGEIFDAEPLLKSLYKKNNKQLLSKNFSSDIKINFNKTLTGTDDDLFNLSMIASLKKGKYNKLILKGDFSKNEIVEMSIYQVDQNKQTLQVISDRARPFIKNFDFIKGFEGGKLEYESISSNQASNSSLSITDFKVSEVPSLAQLLTLASLQGIADTLSGEGIRFESFDMKSNSKGNVINIEDALAMGPAVSILLNGYVDKGNVVSLRGTLVPATKLNSIIASIPVVGEILVGKKTGEGVVGVSFKMKGPPKDIKTTVNPIKTLTPRFIVRAVEKLKKKKQEQAK